MRLVNTIAAIRSCGVLHNMSRMFQDPVPEDDDEEDSDMDQDEGDGDNGEEDGGQADGAAGGAVAVGGGGRPAGEAHRDHLLATYL
jgi:hypothetical protein